MKNLGARIHSALRTPMDPAMSSPLPPPHHPDDIFVGYFKICFATCMGHALVSPFHLGKIRSATTTVNNFTK